MDDTTKWQAGQITERVLGIVSVKLSGRDPSPQRVTDLCVDHMRRPDAAVTTGNGQLALCPIRVLCTGKHRDEH